SEYGLFHRYDGCNLVSNDIKLFKKLIFPYIKHKEKINKIRLITEKRGKLGIMFINILDIINRYPGKKAPELAKMLNKKKIYAQLKLLSDLNYIYYNKYPKRFYMTDKGSKEVSGYDLPD
ncbi:MAG: hypothetical protein ISS36_03005, partial [Candidatus Aenigmarchaeota archaeon]|nr:hypothetical protein [Candidatus Aenigmarchaeota archaeon]